MINACNFSRSAHFFGKVSDLKGMRTGIISFNLYMVFKNYLSKCNHIKIIDINFQIEGY